MTMTDDSGSLVPRGPSDPGEPAVTEEIDRATRAALAATERWFVRAGVPHFVEDRLGAGPVPRLLQPFAAVVDLLRLGTMLAFWTVRRVVAEAREMGHLAVRALPLLALF